MHILYVDESGPPSGDTEQKYFILAGVSVFERQTHWVAKPLNEIAVRIGTRFNHPQPQEVELHGSPMRGGKGIWRKVPPAIRKQAIKDALQVLVDSHQSTCAFAIAVNTSEIDDDSMEYAFLQLASRFDRYLIRLFKRSGNKERERGMILFDKSAHERTLQSLTTLYRDHGNEWGKLWNLSEVPAFIDSKASRLIQLADLVAYAVGRKVNYNDDSYFSIIKSRFDHDGTKGHGFRMYPKPDVKTT